MTRRWVRAVLVLGVAASAVALAQCGDRPEPASAAGSTPSPPPVSAPAALTRADMVGALDRAASAFAAGDIASDGSIAGRTFLIRLPFGCAGPAPEGAKPPAGVADWAWSPDRATIRLTATPADWTRSPLVVPPGAEPAWDAVEGFWIARPWLASEACPAANDPAAPPAAAEVAADASEPLPPPVAPSPMTAGLAAIHDVDGSRLGRRDGRAYTFVARGKGDVPPTPPADGYRLVLAGRVGAFPDGRAVRCVSDGPERRPTCIAAVELDVVAFEDAAGNRLSEWRPG